MADYIIKIPTIKNADYTPKPATINQKFVLRVFVDEITKILTPEIIYSGEIYSGEIELWQ